MDTIQAIILAVVQGITEFLPISSSAHLILLPELFGWQDQGLAYDVAVHVGTLLAVMVFLNKEIQAIVPAWFIGWRGFSWDTPGKLAWLLVLATIPVALVGWLAGDLIETYLREAWVIAASTLLFGLLLGWADRGADKNVMPMESLNWKQTVFVGLAQALALIPGTSRSGITMTALLSIGYSRIAAARFSFLMAVPAIAGAGLLKTKDLVESDVLVAWDLMAIGVFTSAVTAFLCMKVFMRFVQRVGMLPFVIYRILLAAVIVLLMI